MPSTTLGAPGSARSIRRGRRLLFWPLLRFLLHQSWGVRVSVTPSGMLESVRGGSFVRQVLTHASHEVDPLLSVLVTHVTSVTIRTTGLPVLFSSHFGLSEASPFAPSCIGMAGVSVLVSGSGGYIISKSPPCPQRARGVQSSSWRQYGSRHRVYVTVFTLFSNHRTYRSYPPGYR